MAVYVLINIVFLQTLEYAGFCELSLENKNSIIKIIDDCGNRWDCIVIYQSLTDKKFKIGGQWKRMVDARRIKLGAYIMLGAPIAGNNKTIYFSRRRITI